MTRILYAVIATLPSPAVAEEYVAWLEDGHVDRVIDGGAHSAIIVRLERREGDGFATEARQVMTEYIFATRELFSRYEREFAPALREDGRRRFGVDRSISMTRIVGEIV